MLMGINEKYHAEGLLKYRFKKVIECQSEQADSTVSVMGVLNYCMASLLLSLYSHLPLNQPVPNLKGSKLAFFKQ
jgi:hypothetical protein